jgi:hypothetical protein
MPDLSTLTNAELESLWCDLQLTDDTALEDAATDEMMRRPAFCPQSYDLLWTLQDQGWQGGVTQDERDSR